MVPSSKGAYILGIDRGWHRDQILLRDVKEVRLLSTHSESRVTVPKLERHSRIAHLPRRQRRHSQASGKQLPASGSS